MNFPHSLRQLSGLNVPFPVDFGLELTADYNGDCFQKIIFSDSHDTAANGQVRLNEAITPGNAESATARQHTLVTSAALLTAPGIPLLMQGQEFMQEGDFSDWRELEWPKVEQFSGIVTAHKHLLDLRLNQYGNTAGLLGKNTSLFHANTQDNVYAYHRWDKGGAGDDVIIVLNFGGADFDEYKLQIPVAGNWSIRFNSTWSGYESGSTESSITSVQTDDKQTIAIPVVAYSALILSQNP